MMAFMVLVFVMVMVSVMVTVIVMVSVMVTVIVMNAHLFQVELSCNARSFSLQLLPIELCGDINHSSVSI